LKKAREILKEEEKSKPRPRVPKVKLPRSVGKLGRCSSLGEPHYKTFFGKHF